MPVFRRSRWLLEGLFSDVRAKDGRELGSALLFNMEQLFETVLGHRIRHACQSFTGSHLVVSLQKPVKSLDILGNHFQLRPDITVRDGESFVAILDAKWKLLDKSKRNWGVSSSDAYQMNAYASRYRCNHITLVYPASFELPKGHVTEFILKTEEQPVIEVVAVDIEELAFGSGMPHGLEKITTLGREKDFPQTERRGEMTAVAGLLTAT